jgi:hypothetical protein
MLCVDNSVSVSAGCVTILYSNVKVTEHVFCTSVLELLEIIDQYCTPGKGERGLVKEMLPPSQNFNFRLLGYYQPSV